MLYGWNFNIPGRANGVYLQPSPDENEAVDNLRFIYGRDAQLIVEARNAESEEELEEWSPEPVRRGEDTVRGLDSSDGVSPPEVELQPW